MPRKHCNASLFVHNDTVIIYSMALLDHSILTGTALKGFAWRFQTICFQG